ncbi:MAG: T9SS type A sorting domain-containing protein [Bacteroidales bacterium]|nr:T9SS type A sorting domain-containing protein [Bacteroidales bacterium]
MKNLAIIIFILANMSIFAQNTYVPDDNFEQALIDLGYDTVLDDYVPTTNINEITFLDVTILNISNLTGIEDFTALSILNCNSNQLTGLNISQNTNLTQLDCYENQLTSLDVSQNTNLSVLVCHSNQMSDLDVSQNINLTFLWCFGNQLTNLDVRNDNNTNLTDFNAENNPNLTCIFVDDAAWSEINWTNIDPASTFVETQTECDALQQTYVPDDNFEQALIDLGYDSGALDDYVPTANISGITSLFVNNKSISDLTGIEDFIALTFLDCNSNQLISLDVTQNANLNYLRCQYNQLTSLNVSQNTQLISLFCYSNQLTSLDVRNGSNENITSFYAEDNPNLTCIFVDNKNATYLSDWTIDPVSTFVETQAECDALGVNDIINDAGFAIYPNPAKEKFSIQTSNEIENLKIFDIFGKLLKVYNKQESYSVSDLASGVYLIYVQSKAGVSISKLIIE